MDEQQPPDESPSVYEIKVKERIEGSRWAAWFGGMSIHLLKENGTVLRGALPDQAALYGLLSRLRDLALTLVSVRRVDDNDGER